MTKTLKSILPIIAVFLGLFLGCSTTNAQTIDKLKDQLREVQNLPSGSVFQLKLTEEEATAASAEYLARYTDEIQNIVQQSVGVSLEFSDPQINFEEDKIIISIRGGVGFLKIKASASGKVFWDTTAKTLKVDVQSVDIPIISVDSDTVNSYIQGPLNDFVSDLMKDYEVLSFNIFDGHAILEARKN